MSQIEGLPDQHEDPRVAAGLRAQLARWRERTAAGARRVGWKIGVNDPRVQQQLGLRGPVIGYVTGESLLTPGASVALEEGARYAIEAELGVIMGRDLAGDVDLDLARAAIEALVPAIELQDQSRRPASLEDLLEHNVLHAGAAFGTECHKPWDVPLDALRVRALRNGEQRRHLDPSLLPCDLGAIAKLVADSLARHGETLQAGDRILAGSLIAPLRVRPGDTARVEIEPLGELTLTFCARAGPR